ncbi:hypothetical protein EQM11_00360, partial [Klebsiella pneumoniae]|nr:hypothetical protein [Klebsiella pneumoniae]
PIRFPDSEEIETNENAASDVETVENSSVNQLKSESQEQSEAITKSTKTKEDNGDDRLQFFDE